MKTITNIFLPAIVLSLALAAQAETSWWAALNTAACPYGDEKPSTANAASYSVYYCDTKTANDLFQANDIWGVAAYLRDNYEKGKADLARDGRAIGTWSYYAVGQYSFQSEDYDEPLDTQLSYLAVAFYGDDAFRVFANDVGSTGDGHVVFDDAKVGMSTSWAPEPTSGLLLLLGSALLAIRRKASA